METFAKEVHVGLKSRIKYLPSKYFYDQNGDLLFQKIMEMPEYYLTRTEFSILEKNKEALLKPIFSGKNKFNLIELGVGDGLKTKILIQHLYKNGISFDYYPIDISPNILSGLKLSLRNEFPELEVKSIAATYSRALSERNWDSSQPSLMIFLGSNIGNFKNAGILNLLKSMAHALNRKDKLLLGVDLKKDPEIILNAYNDKQGITKAFNFNLLNRINRELGGNFQIENFKHWPVYDPVSGECKSYLISLKHQEVWIEALQTSYTFETAEPVHTEISRKFHLHELDELSVTSGFKVIGNFTDEKKYFTDSLWEKT